MKPLVLITSVIDTPNKPFSYCEIRSVYTREQRYEQTKKTIESIRMKIPNCIIVLVECSDLQKHEIEYFNNTCDYIMNLWNDKELHDSIFGISKALGEGTMTIKALEYILNNNIEFDNLFKISGRYWLNDKFKYSNFDNNCIMCKKIHNDINNILTALYKIPYKYVSILYIFLRNNIEKMKQCIGYEMIFAMYVKQLDNVIYCDNLGVSGMISVTQNEYFEG